MSSRQYSFYVKPLSPSANEAIAEWFNDQGDSAATLEHLNITVADNLVDGVYEVPSRFVAELKRSDHKQDVRVYVKEGGGKIRPYFLYLNRNQSLARTKPVAKIKKQIAALKQKTTTT